MANTKQKANSNPRASTSKKRTYVVSSKAVNARKKNGAVKKNGSTPIAKKSAHKATATRPGTKKNSTTHGSGTKSLKDRATAKNPKITLNKNRKSNGTNKMIPVSELRTSTAEPEKSKYTKEQLAIAKELHTSPSWVKSLMQGGRNLL